MSQQPSEKVHKLLSALYSAIARRKVTPEEIAEIKARLSVKAAQARRRRSS